MHGFNSHFRTLFSQNRPKQSFEIYINSGFLNGKMISQGIFKNHKVLSRLREKSFCCWNFFRIMVLRNSASFLEETHYPKTKALLNKWKWTCLWIPPCLSLLQPYSTTFVNFILSPLCFELVQLYFYWYHCVLEYYQNTRNQYHYIFNRY